MHVESKDEIAWVDSSCESDWDWDSSDDESENEHGESLCNMFDV